MGQYRHAQRHSIGPILALNSKGKVHHLMRINICLHNMRHLTHHISPRNCVNWRIISHLNIALAQSNASIDAIAYGKCVTWHILCSRMLTWLIRINWCTLLRDFMHFDLCCLVPVLGQSNADMHVYIGPLMCHYWPPGLTHYRNVCWDVGLLLRASDTRRGVVLRGCPACKACVMSSDRSRWSLSDRNSARGAKLHT